MSKLETFSAYRMHGGEVRFLKHKSASCACDMTFSVFLPAEALAGESCPVLYWLSGLTCTAENFTVKAGAQQHAARHGLILVAPDTSPRGENVPDDEACDLGQGAGFYLNAEQAPWNRHYKMYNYVACELPHLVEQAFSADSGRIGIFGHSMGGHGALMIALKNPGRYRSVSAFAPIAAPASCPWGAKAFGAYLGPDREAWKEWDSTELIARASERLPLLVDQGAADGFLEQGQLQPETLQAACEQYHHPLKLRMQEGYDHSYYFIATFMGEHVAHHAKALGMA